MKTTKYYIIAAMLFSGLAFAHAAGKGSMHGHDKHRPDSAKQNVVAGNTMQSGDVYATKSFCNGIFLQDIRIYNIGNEPRMVISYIPQAIATKTPYMGFKVGDRVKWGSPVDKKMIEEYGTNNQYLTGTVSMLDSDKCYIMIDHSSKVAVKPYEDVVKINP